MFGTKIVSVWHCECRQSNELTDVPQMTDETGRCRARVGRGCLPLEAVVTPVTLLRSFIPVHRPR